VLDANFARMMTRLSSLCVGGPEANSFTAGTPVLLANGTSKAIEDIDVGEQILAMDMTTGMNSAQSVLDVITGSGAKDLVDITVDADGTSGDATAEITATDKHPFWVADQQVWRNAADLVPGQRLRSSAGAEVSVVDLRRRSESTTVHNLSVAIHHTYYVMAASTSMLVHNAGPGCGSLWIRADKVAHHYMRLSDTGETHASQFGVFGPYNKENGELFIRAVERFIKNPTTMVIYGTWRKQPAIHYVNPESGLHASFAANGPSVGEYLGGWKSEGDQLRYLLLYGKL
jgi:hypothetical protein